jgi:hypothetical protein
MLGTLRQRSQQAGCEDLPLSLAPFGRQEGQTIFSRIIGRVPYMRATVTPACANGYSAFLTRNTDVQGDKMDEFAYVVEISCTHRLLSAPLKELVVHHAFRYFKASMISSPGAFRSGEESFCTAKGSLAFTSCRVSWSVKRLNWRILGNCCPKMSHRDIGFEPIIAMSAPRG